MFDRPFGKAGDGFPSYNPEYDDPWSGVFDQTGPAASNRVVIIHDDPPEPGGGDNSDDGNGSASGRPGTGSGREGDKEHPATDDENDDWFEDLFDDIFDFLGDTISDGSGGAVGDDWSAVPGQTPWDDAWDTHPPVDNRPPPITIDPVFGGSSSWDFTPWWDSWWKSAPPPDPRKVVCDANEIYTGFTDYRNRPDEPDDPVCETVFSKKAENLWQWITGEGQGDCNANLSPKGWTTHPGAGTGDCPSWGTPVE